MTAINATRSKAIQLWREYRATLLFLLLMFMFRSAWADWMTVPSGSMNPTILEGDRILVDKHAFGLRLPWTLVRLTEGRDPERGEIVVFDSPVDGTSLVKRIVGVPGDVISADDLGLLINGVRADYQPGDATVIDRLVSETRARHPDVLVESRALPAHRILRLPGRSGRDRFGPVRVPEDHYFMLGDNRDNSADSRYIGFVPRRNIVGVASRVVVSLDPEKLYLPRGDRWLHALE